MPKTRKLPRFAVIVPTAMGPLSDIVTAADKRSAIDALRMRAVRRGSLGKSRDVSLQSVAVPVATPEKPVPVSIPSNPKVGDKVPVVTAARNDAVVIAEALAAASDLFASRNPDPAP